MLRLTMLLMVVVLFACGSAQASVVSDLTTSIVDFAKDTITQPDAISGSVTGDGTCISFEKQYAVDNVPGLKTLDLYAGLGVANEAPGLRFTMTVTITNIKGTQLAVGLRTREAEDATWVADLGPLGRVGAEPVIELRRAM